MDYQDILNKSLSNRKLDLKTVTLFGNPEILDTFMKMNGEKIEQIKLDEALLVICHEVQCEDEIIKVLLKYGANPFYAFDSDHKTGVPTQSSLIRALRCKGNANTCILLMEKSKHKLYFSSKNFTCILKLLILLHKENKVEKFFNYFSEDFTRLKEYNPDEYLDFVYQIYGSGFFSVMLDHDILPIIVEKGKNIFPISDRLEEDEIFTIIDKLVEPVILEFNKYTHFGKKKRIIEDYYFVHMSKNIKGGKR